VAEAYLQFLYTLEGQELAAKHHFRPREATLLGKWVAKFPKIELFTIDEVFGGWQKAQAEHFAEGAIFDQILKR
jgi:sulfate transport system substrate-binding protein